MGSHLSGLDGWQALVDELEDRITENEDGDEGWKTRVVDVKSFPVDEKTGIKEIPYYLAQPHTRPLDTSGQNPHAATSSDEVRNSLADRESSFFHLLSVSTCTIFTFDTPDR